MHIIEGKNLTFSYEDKPERHVIRNMSFGVEEGSITVLLGLSGCGKSTLCQIICGIIPGCIGGELEGELYFRGEDITDMKVNERALKTGYVMQDPDRQMIATTVEDELAFGPENLCMDPAEIREKADSIMKMLNITHLAGRTPGQLSGGEKQVVAIGAILALDPEVIVMDEPMSHLDSLGRELVCSAVKELKKAGKTVIIVEQDYEIVDFADKWMIMEEGVIKKEGTPAAMISGGPCFDTFCR